MQRSDLLPRVLRGVALALVLIFFLFPIVWIIQMSFHTNDSILSSTPQPFAPLTLSNYVTLISGKLVTPTGTQDVNFLGNLGNSFLLAASSVALSLVLGIPAAYAFARFRFRGGEDIAFTLLSFRFAPPLLVLLPLSLYYQDLGLSNTYVGLIWVYQLITLPLILWIVRGYFEDASPDIEYAYRVDGHSWWRGFTRIAIPLAKPGIAAAALLSFIFAWNNFVFALILASSDKQPVTVGALNFITSAGIPYGQVAAAVVLSIVPTLAIALYAQKWLVEGLSLGAVKG